jgi:hypothetical protein
MNIQASVAKGARRWPERGRADGGQEFYWRGVAPLPSCGWLGLARPRFRITQPR